MAKPDIQFAIENRSIAVQITTLLNSNTLPVRITHNDTKLDNILFDLKNDCTYIINLDTVMKGSILFDFGDMVRSITSLA
ncbi:MAG: phosphotransferase [Bacteroidetes bacterium]|nr:phosphotransferase [Bacteroidota bacterium]